MNILNEIAHLFPFVVTFSIVVFLIIILTFFILKKFNPKGRKLKIYGIFLGLTTTNTISISLIVVRYLFFIYCLFQNHYVSIFEDVHFYFFLISDILYNLLNKIHFNILLDSLNSVILYFILFSKMVFHDYIFTVQNVWYVVLIYVLLLIFTFVYGTYFTIKDIDYVVKKNKHIQRKLKKGEK